MKKTLALFFLLAVAAVFIYVLAASVSFARGGNFNESEERSFTIIDSAPTLSLLSPANNYSSSVKRVSFNWSANDSESQTLNCTFYINGSAVQNYSTYSINTQINYSADFEAGNYNWSVTCRDGSGNLASETRTYSVTLTCDSSAPVVDLQSPRDNLNSTKNTLTAEWIATDESEKLTCTLMLYNSKGTNIYTYTKSSLTGVLASTVFPTLSNGTYRWNVTCLDDCCNIGVSKTRTFTIGETKNYCGDGICNNGETPTSCPEDCTPGKNFPPTVGLISPVCYYALTSLPVNFTWKASDDSSSSLSCTLYVDKTQVGTYSVQNGVEYSVQYSSSLSAGLHSWNVSCSDGSLSSSALEHFIYNPNGGNCTSKISAELLSPPNGAVINKNSVDLKWNAESTGASLACGLIYDNKIVENNRVMSGEATYSLSNITQGTHGWSAVCWDRCTIGDSAICGGPGKSNSISTPTWYFAYDSAAYVSLAYDAMADQGECPGSHMSLPVVIRNIGSASSFGIGQTFSCDDLGCSLFPSGTVDIVQGGAAAFELNLYSPEAGVSKFVGIFANDSEGNSASEGFVITGTNASACAEAAPRDPRKTDIGSNGTMPFFVSRNCSVIIDAPLEALCNGGVQVNVTCDNDIPLSGAFLTVFGPSGSQELMIDAKGSASFVAEDEGYYFYEVPGVLMRSTVVTSVYCENSTGGVKTLVVPLYITEASKLDITVFREGRQPQKAAVKIFRPTQLADFANTTSYGTYEEVITLPGNYVYTISASNVRSLSAKMELNKLAAQIETGGDISMLLIILIVMAISVAYTTRRQIIALLVKKKLVLISFEKKKYEPGELVEISFKIKDLNRKAADTPVSIISDDGEETVLMTDRKGRVIFIPEKEGIYHISMRNYIIEGLDSVIVAAKEK